MQSLGRGGRGPHGLGRDGRGPHGLGTDGCGPYGPYTDFSPSLKDRARGRGPVGEALLTYRPFFHTGDLDRGRFPRRGRPTGGLPVGTVPPLRHGQDTLEGLGTREEG